MELARGSNVKAIVLTLGLTGCVTASGQQTLPPLVDGHAPGSFDELWAGFDARAEPLEVEVLREWEEDGVLLGDTADDLSWQDWGLGLPVEFDRDAQQDGVNTAFPGVAEEEATLTWMVTAMDGTGPVDCVVWGLDPAHFRDYGCRDIVPAN